MLRYTRRFPLLWKINVHHHHDKITPLHHTMSQLNPLHTNKTYFIKTSIVIILHLFLSLLPWYFPTRISYAFLLSLIHTTYTTLFKLSDISTLIPLEIKLWVSLLRNCLHFHLILSYKHSPQQITFKNFCHSSFLTISALLDWELISYIQV
jgi:hypothetical protein